MTTLLETFPGWPEAPDVPAWQFWMLMVILPVAASALIAALVLLVEKLRGSSGTTPVAVAEDRGYTAGPDAHEVVRDAAAREDAIDRGQDPTPASSPESDARH